MRGGEGDKEEGELGKEGREGRGRERGKRMEGGDGRGRRRGEMEVEGPDQVSREIDAPDTMHGPCMTNLTH